MKLSPNPKPFRFTLGERGEAAAAGLIQKKGFKILQKNYKCAFGEIDLVAEKDGRIRFIEIKTRSGKRFGDPAEAVDRQKQRKLIRLAEWYLKEHKLGEPKVSFDVAAVIWKAGAAPEVRLIEDAFERQDEGS